MEVIGIDMGGSAIKAGYFENGALRGQTRVPTLSDEGREAILRQILSCIRCLCITNCKCCVRISCFICTVCSFFIHRHSGLIITDGIQFLYQIMTLFQTLNRCFSFLCCCIFKIPLKFLFSKKRLTIAGIPPVII